MDEIKICCKKCADMFFCKKQIVGVSMYRFAMEKLYKWKESAYRKQDNCLKNHFKF